MDAFLKSLPHEHAEYMATLQQTQGKHLSLIWAGSRLNIHLIVLDI
jgi:hypothetical protein